MIPKKLNKVEYLKSCLSEQNPIQIDKHIFFFPSSRIGLFNTFISKKMVKTFPHDTVWITSNRFFFRKNISRMQPLFLLKKENETYKIYDRRYLKLGKGTYFLPPVETSLIFSEKPYLLHQKEKELFFPVREGNFFCEGDTTSRLLDPLYLERLEKRSKEKKPPSKGLSKLFLFLKEKLDR